MFCFRNLFSCFPVKLSFSVSDSDIEDDSIDADVKKIKKMRKQKSEPSTDTDSEAPTPGPSVVKTEPDVESMHEDVPVKKEASVAPVKRPYVRKADKDDKGEGKKKPGRPKSQSANQEQTLTEEDSKESENEKKPVVGKDIQVKKEAGEALEIIGKAKSRKKSASAERDSSGSEAKRAKIEMYLNDGRRRAKLEPKQTEEKKQFKTYEEAFLYSISGTLGPRNAAKKNFEQYACNLSKAVKTEVSGKKEKQRRASTSDLEENKAKDIKKENGDDEDTDVKFEPSGNCEKNLSEDLEVLKHDTDKFLEKYKKDKPPDKSEKNVSELKTEPEKGFVAVSGDSAGFEKKMAAKSVNEQKVVCIRKEASSSAGKSNVPQDLVEKHKDLGQELIQLTHDIIQQQNTKSHKFLEQGKRGPMGHAAQKPGYVQVAGSVDQSRFSKPPVFGESVSGQMARPMTSPQNQMFIREFGSASSGNLDFSQLASHAKQIEKLRAEKPDMNLMFTIQKLSSSLQGQPAPSRDDQKGPQVLPGPSVQLKTAAAVGKPAEKTMGKKDPRQPTILRQASSGSKAASRKSPVTSPRSEMVSPTLPGYQTPAVIGAVRCQQISPNQSQRSAPISPRGVVSPKQAQPLSPQSYSTMVQIQSPTGMRKEIPTSPSSNRKSPVRGNGQGLVMTSQSLVSPAISASAVSFPASHFVQNTQSASLILQQAPNIQQTTVGVLNQLQGQIANTQGNKMISNVQQVVTAANPGIAQTLGQVLAGGQLLTCVQPQVTPPGVQTQALAGSSTFLLRPQTLQQFPGRIITQQLLGGNIVTSPHVVNTSGQNVVQVQLPSTGVNQGANVEGMQSRIISNGNQTFLVNIPVVRPITSTGSGSGAQLSTGNKVTIVSSQGKQNQVGNAVMPQSVSAVKTLVVSSANGKTVGALAPISIVTSSVDSSSVTSGSVKVVGNQTVSGLLLAAQKNKAALLSANLSKNLSDVRNTSGTISLVQGSPTSISTNATVTLSSISNSLQSTVVSSSGTVFTVDSFNSQNLSQFIKDEKCDVSLPQKSSSLSPPPILQSPNKALQLIPQPIVPISQTFSSTTSTTSSTVPSHLLEGEDSEDVKPPILEMEPPMLEMEAPILKMESEHDTVSIKSDPDTLSNYSVGSNSLNLVSSFKQEPDSLYPMSSSGFETAQTIVQTSSYNSFMGNSANSKQACKKRRRKSGPEVEKNLNVVDIRREFYSDGEESMPSNQVGASFLLSSMLAYMNTSYGNLLVSVKTSVLCRGILTKSD